MQHVVFVEPGKLEWRATRAAALQGPNEAIVRPIVVGRCDLDTLYLSGRMPLAGGEPIGHEVIAEVVEPGENAARRLHVGQRVIVSAQICCGRCNACRRGSTGRCEMAPFGASFGMGRAGDYGGGLADLMRIPFADAMLVPIPSNAEPLSMIGLADMSTDAWRAIGPALRQRPGAAVLVLGGAAPVIGIYAAGMAVSLGAGLVDYVDHDAKRRERAAAYGARTMADMEESDHHSYEVVVDASGNAERLLSGLHRIAPDAIVTAVSPDTKGVTFPMLELYMKGVTYKVGRPDCRAGHDGALHAWSVCGFDPNIVKPTIYPFARAHEAWCDPAVYVAVSRLM